MLVRWIRGDLFFSYEMELVMEKRYAYPTSNFSHITRIRTQAKNSNLRYIYTYTYNIRSEYSLSEFSNKNFPAAINSPASAVDLSPTSADTNVCFRVFYETASLAVSFNQVLPTTIRIHPYMCTIPICIHAGGSTQGQETDDDASSWVALHVRAVFSLSLSLCFRFNRSLTPPHRASAHVYTL